MIKKILKPRKISEEQIKAIKASNKSYSQLAKEYNVSKPYIQIIKNGRYKYKNTNDNKLFRDALEDYLRMLPDDKRMLIVKGNNSESLIPVN